MSTPQYYERLHVPNVSGPLGEYTSPELLYSTAGFTQKGVTLAGGQGVLTLGTPLVRGSDKKYYAHPSARADDFEFPDGVTSDDIARGFLRRGADLGPVGSADQLGNIVIAGIVKISMLPVEADDLDTLADELNGRYDTARDTFKI